MLWSHVLTWGLLLRHVQHALWLSLFAKNIQQLHKNSNLVFILLNTLKNLTKSVSFLSSSKHMVCAKICYFYWPTLYTRNNWSTFSNCTLAQFSIFNDSCHCLFMTNSRTWDVSTVDSCVPLWNGCNHITDDVDGVESILSPSHNCHLSNHLSISHWPNCSQMVACQDEHLRSYVDDTSTATACVENSCLADSFSAYTYTLSISNNNFPGELILAGCPFFSTRSEPLQPQTHTRLTTLCLGLLSEAPLSEPLQPILHTPFNAIPQCSNIVNVPQQNTLIQWRW